jgi:hypothetical protein
MHGFWSRIGAGLIAVITSLPAFAQELPALPETLPESDDISTGGNLMVKERTTTPRDPSIELPSSGTVTPEMWFYTQEYQRYKSPKEAVRRKAEARAAQRQNRLAAQRWFGLSNSRPVASPVPYFGVYSPSWVGNTWSPYYWSGANLPYVTYYTTYRHR